MLDNWGLVLQMWKDGELLSEVDQDDMHWRVN